MHRIQSDGHARPQTTGLHLRLARFTIGRLSRAAPEKYPEDFAVFCERLGLPDTRLRVMAWSDELAREHTLKETSDLWASDWTGAYAGRLPDGQPWSFQDYFNAERFMVNPAIVHAMPSKEALVGSDGGE